ncbi:hypothetical protein DPEC_G00360710 [Dallia pectoralis]|uniref:Uncharacterized protein n=1 Tax=Dallia pectoralis TaxID=75939 RepID=A0ACC2F0W5_DALPE|nr:hypothetical protein DPEC_G00360710 [Dallia pectoralis]
MFENVQGLADGAVARRGAPGGDARSRGEVSSRANGHTTVNIMTLSGSPAHSRLAASLPSCPIRYCLISSAKQPLPCQPLRHLLPNKMAAAQLPRLVPALLPGSAGARA